MAVAILAPALFCRKCWADGFALCVCVCVGLCRSFFHWVAFDFFVWNRQKVDSAVSVFILYKYYLLGCVCVMSFCISRQVQVEVQRELKIIQVYLTIFIQSIEVKTKIERTNTHIHTNARVHHTIPHYTTKRGTTLNEKKAKQHNNKKIWPELENRE